MLWDPSPDEALHKVIRSTPQSSMHVCAICGYTTAVAMTYEFHLITSHGYPAAAKPRRELGKDGMMGVLRGVLTQAKATDASRSALPNRPSSAQPEDVHAHDAQKERSASEVDDHREDLVYLQQVSAPEPPEPEDEVQTWHTKMASGEDVVDWARDGASETSSEAERRGQDELLMSRLFQELDETGSGCISAETMENALHVYGLSEFKASPEFPFVNATDFVSVACAELEALNRRFHRAPIGISDITTAKVAARKFKRLLATRKFKGSFERFNDKKRAVKSSHDASHQAGGSMVASVTVAGRFDVAFDDALDMLRAAAQQLQDASLVCEQLQEQDVENEEVRRIRNDPGRKGFSDLDLVRTRIFRQAQVHRQKFHKSESVRSARLTKQQVESWEEGDGWGSNKSIDTKTEANSGVVTPGKRRSPAASPSTSKSAMSRPASSGSGIPSLGSTPSGVRDSEATTTRTPLASPAAVGVSAPASKVRQKCRGPSQAEAQAAAKLDAELVHVLEMMRTAKLRLQSVASGPATRGDGSGVPTVEQDEEVQKRVVEETRRRQEPLAEVARRHRAEELLRKAVAARAKAIAAAVKQKEANVEMVGRTSSSSSQRDSGGVVRLPSLSAAVERSKNQDPGVSVAGSFRRQGGNMPGVPGGGWWWTCARQVLVCGVCVGVGALFGGVSTETTLFGVKAPLFSVASGILSGRRGDSALEQSSPTVLIGWL